MCLTLLSCCHAEGSVSILRGGGRLGSCLPINSLASGGGRWAPFIFRSPNFFRISLVVISPLELKSAGSLRRSARLSGT